MRKISDCWSFSDFKTLPGCQSFRHSDKIYFRVIWIEARHQLQLFGRHCKFHLNFKSYKHQIEWIFVQESLRRSTTNSRNWMRIAWTSSWSDVTTVLCPDPYLWGCGPFRTQLQRGIKNRGFDQIRKFENLKRNDHQSMKIFFRKKKFTGLVHFNTPKQD